jgi:hypothetical protein
MSDQPPIPTAATDAHSLAMLQRHAQAEKLELYTNMVRVFQRDNPSCPQHVFHAYCEVLAEELGL